MAEGTSNKDTTSAEEWERRLVSGDLPEDFLQVTEPKSMGAAASDDVTAAQATATLTSFERGGQQPSATSNATTPAPAPVVTGALLDLGEDIPTPPEGQRQGRDPNLSVNVEEEAGGISHNSYFSC